MRILYLVHRIPFPPDKGDKIRSYHWLEALGRRHEVHVATLRDDPADDEHIPELRKRAASCVVAPLEPGPARMRALVGALAGRALSVGYFDHPLLRRAVAERLEKGVDLAFCFSGPMASYVEGRRGLPKIMDLVDVDSAKFAAYSRLKPFPRNFIDRFEASRLGAYEDRIARTFDRTLLCTEPEAEILRKRVPGAPIEALGNGVVLPNRFSAEPRRSHRMLFIGAMDYWANVDAVVYAAREILPIVRRSVPDATYHIVGRNPAPAVLELAGLDGVHVHGAVPDLGAHLEAARLALVPLRVAQGIQNKVLEAMANGVPVVTADNVARSLGARSGQVLRAGSSAEELAAHAVTLLDDDDLARRLAIGARAFVESEYSWEPRYRALEALVEEVRERCSATNTSAAR